MPKPEQGNISEETRRILRTESAPDEQRAPGETFEQGFEHETPERKALLKVASALLTREPLPQDNRTFTNEQLLDTLQTHFQHNLEAHYRSSGLEDRVKALALHETVAPSHRPLDEQACDLIAEASQGTHGWVDMLPNLRDTHRDTGMNCTMGTAMLHCALEQLGMSGVRTVLRDGHHVLIRELDDGGMKLYDATSLSTKNDHLVGYTRTFSPTEVVRGTEVPDRGYAFRLRSKEEDRIGGLDRRGSDGTFDQSFFAYEPEVKMDLGIALGNLAEIKRDAAVLNEGHTLPFDLDAYKEALYQFLLENNASSLSQEFFVEIANSNRQQIEELLKAAATCFEGQAAIPNPFDFLSSPLLAPKPDLTLPDPKTFKGSAERYEQAKELCERYPSLKELDFEELKMKMSLFDAHAYL